MPKTPKPAGRQSQLRVGRFSEAWECYVITKVFQHRENRGIASENARIVIDCLNFLREKDRIKLYAFCLMPDHLHLAFCLLPGESLSKVVSAFTKYTAKQVNLAEGRRGTVWQHGFHDRRCRDADELADLCAYIEHNPVRAGLVELAAEWRFSSANPKHRWLLDREWWP